MGRWDNTARRQTAEHRCGAALLLLQVHVPRWAQQPAAVLIWDTFSPLLPSSSAIPSGEIPLGRVMKANANLSQPKK